jgi:hypothetical protein
VNGSWLIAGNNRIAQLNLFAGARRDQGAQTGSEVYVDVTALAPTGTVSGASITDASGITGWSDTALSSTGTEDEIFSPTPGTTSTLILDEFSLPIENLTTLVPAGTLFTYTVTPVSGSVETHKRYSNTFTQELISIASPTDSTFADYLAGSSQTVTWTLPTTFPVANVQLFAQAYTGAEGLSTTEHCST